MPIIIMKNLVDQARQEQDKRVDGNWTVANIQIALVLLENIVYQENGDEGNADEENVHYQDYCDEENEI